MSRYYGGWAPYVPVAQRRVNAARAVEKLRKKGQTLAPVTISGRAIATTFWGKAWCDNMESYQDYENRLPRGRTYVRNGSVLDLQIAPGEVTALVSGSEIYRVAISIKEEPPAKWQAICKDCAGGIDSLVELLQGRFSKGVMERLCRQENGLFPRPSDIRFSCSCPDHASMCKHVAAVLYGVGARLDHKPELLFRLRAVDEAELVTRIDTTLPMTKQGPATGRVLQSDDVSALFGLDMAEGDAPAAAQPAGKAKPRGGFRAAAASEAPKATAALKPLPRPVAAKPKQVAAPKAPAKAPARNAVATTTKTAPSKPTRPAAAKATASRKTLPRPVAVKPKKAAAPKAPAKAPARKAVATATKTVPATPPVVRRAEPARRRPAAG